MSLNAVIANAQALRGDVRVPPDKAITHRVLLLSAVAAGSTEIVPWSAADDCHATLAVLQGLGVPTRLTEGRMRVEGVGLDGLTAPAMALPCGESGTTMRLSAGLLAGQPFRAVLDGGPSLHQRPMQRIAEPLIQMGATVEGAARPGTTERYPPLTIHGRRPLTAISYRPAVASAQVKSAILLAGLFAAGRTTVVEPAASRDHTERVLGQCGVVVRREGLAVSVEPATRFRLPERVTVPGDLSSAAFFLTAAACVPGSHVDIREVGLNPTRTRLLDVLRRMGASIDVEVAENDAWEPCGRIRVAARPLRATTVEAQDVPALIDEIPALMVAACCANGISRVQGVRELRVKETDRIRSMTQGLARMGATVRVSVNDDLEIEGGRPLTGARVDSEGDHRTAMALTVAGLLAEGSTEVTGVDCVGKSFPEFFDLLQSLTDPATITLVEATE